MMKAPRQVWRQHQFETTNGTINWQLRILGLTLRANVGCPSQNGLFSRCVHQLGHVRVGTGRKPHLNHFTSHRIRFTPQQRRWHALPLHPVSKVGFIQTHTHGSSRLFRNFATHVQFCRECQARDTNLGVLEFGKGVRSSYNAHWTTPSTHLGGLCHPRTPGKQTTKSLHGFSAYTAETET